MNWLEFISSLAWPSIVVGTLFAFRKPLADWFRRSPTKVKAGPIEFEWEKEVDAATGELTAGARLTTASADNDPGAVAEDAGTASRLALRLRNVARVSPVGAIVQAFQEVEEEIYYLVLTTDIPRGPRRLSPFEALRHMRSQKILPDHLYGLLDGLRRLCSLAVHAAGSVDSTQALEFLSLADEAILGIQPIRQERELSLADEEARLPDER